MPASASIKPCSRSKEITRSSERVSMQMLSVANCWAPIECRQPETEMGKPFRDAERTICARVLQDQQVHLAYCPKGMVLLVDAATNQPIYFANRNESVRRSAFP